MATGSASAPHRQPCGHAPARRCLAGTAPKPGRRVGALAVHQPRRQRPVPVHQRAQVQRRQPPLAHDGAPLDPDLARAVHEGAVQRIRPKAMTVTTTFIALLPILWATGTGADVMKRIAAPMVGGIVTSFIGELIVYPVIFFIWKGRGLEKVSLKEEPTEV